MKREKIKFYLLFPTLAVAILILAGCGKSVSQRTSEQIIEKTIEEQSGGTADVNIGDNSMKVETEQGKIETGDNVKLPSDFPNDVYIIEGAIKAVISDQASGGQTISIETNKSVEAVAADYQDKLKADGWKITGTMNFGDSASVIAEKDDRIVSVSAGNSDGKTIVTIGVGKK